MAGAVTASGMIVPEVLQKIGGKIFANITNKRANQVMSGRVGQAIAGFAEGSLTAATEEKIRHEALVALGEQGIGGVHAESWIAAGGISSLIRGSSNRHLHKQNFDLETRIINSQIENSKETMKPISSGMPDDVDLQTRSAELENRIAETHKQIVPEVMKLLEITGDPDTIRTAYKNEIANIDVGDFIEKSVAFQNREYSRSAMTEVAGKMREDLSAHWYQEITKANPDATTQQVKELHTEKMKKPFAAYAEKIQDTMPIDASPEAQRAHIETEVRNLKLSDYSLEATMIDHLEKNVGNPDAFVGGLKQRIDEVNNFKYFDSLYDTVQRYEKAMGFDDGKNSFNLVQESRGIGAEEVIHSMTEKEFKDLAGPVYAKYRKFKQAESNLYKKADDKANTTFKDVWEKTKELTAEAEVALRNLSEDVDVALKLTPDETTRSILDLTHKEIRASNVIEARSRREFGQDIVSMSKYIYDNNIDTTKARTYMDQLDDLARKGELTSDVKQALVDQLKMTDQEISYANKMGNYNRHLEEIAFRMDKTGPDQRLSILNEKLTFDAISDADTGNYYHARQWNAKGTEMINSKYGIKLEETDLVNSNFGRVVDSMAVRSDLGVDPSEIRLDPTSEIVTHLNKLNYAMTFRGQNNAVRGLIDNHFGLRQKSPGQVESYTVDTLSKKLGLTRGLQTSSLDKAVYLIAQNNKNIQSRFTWENKTGKLLDELVSTVGDHASKLAIGSLKPFFHGRNSMQAVQNGLAYIYDFSPRGVFDASADAIASVTKFGKIAAMGGDAKKWMASLDKLPQNEANRIRADIAHEEITNTTAEYMAMDSDSALKVGLKQQIENLKEANTFPEKVKRFGAVVNDSLKYATDLQTFALNASDLAARDTAVMRSLKHADRTIKRYQWKAKNSQHAQKKYNDMIKTLHLDLMSEGRKGKLYNLLDKSLQTGDFFDFKKEYASAWVERLCFGYGVNDAPRYQNTFKQLPKSARLMTRFTNWGVKNRHNLINIGRAAKNGNLAPAAIATMSSVGAYVVGKTIADEYISEDNEWNKMYWQYANGSTYFSNMFNYGSLATRGGEPFSILNSGVKKLVGLGKNTAATVVEELELDMDVERSRQSYEFKVPTLEETVELKDGMKAFFKDAEAALGSQDAFLQSLKDNWEILTEGED